MAHNRDQQQNDVVTKEIEKQPRTPHAANTFSYSPTSSGSLASAKDTAGGQLWLQLEASVKRVVRLSLSTVEFLSARSIKSDAYRSARSAEIGFD